jgi:hemimethylated DNA binding protein
VVIGWDLEVKRPKDWIDEVYKEFPERVQQPHYTVLLDLAQVNLEVAYIWQVIIEKILDLFQELGNM